MAQPEGKPKKFRVRNTELPCPTGQCTGTKDDHRPIRGTKDWFCYECMDVCTSPTP